MASLPTLVYSRIHDIDQLNHQMADWRIDSMPLETGELEIRSEQIIYSDLVVERSRQNFAKQDRYEIPMGTTLFCIFKPGCIPGHWCGFEIPEDVLLINQPGQEHFAVLPEGFDHIAITVSDSLLQRWNLLPINSRFASPISNRALIPLVGSSSMRFRKWIFGQFRSRRKLTSLSTEIETSTHFREALLCGLRQLLDDGLAMQGNSVREFRTVRRFSLIQEACSLVDDQLTTVMTSEQLANRMGIHLRTLQRAFAEMFGMSPSRYVQQRKLLSVRRELRNSTLATSTVSQVAIKYGFTELGRFSLRYRKLFGEHPSQTLRDGTKMFSARSN